MNKMKKLLAACSVAMMMLSVPACAEEADITGDWYGDYMGAVMKMTINDDGTYSVDFGGDISDGTWELTDEGLVMDDQTFTITEDGLVAELGEGFSITFGREELEGFVPAEIDYEADPELLQGDWSAYKMGLNGTYLDVAPGDMSYMEMSISGTTVVMDGFYFEGGVTVEMEE